MITLYGKHGAASVAPMAVFNSLGMDIEFELPDRTSEAYHRINPMGWVPAVVWEDGSVLTESSAIILHTVDVYDADGRLAPPAGTPARARFYEALMFMASQVYPTYQRLYQTRRIADTEYWDHIHAMARAQQANHWTRLDQWLSERTWLAGDDFSAADIYLLMLVTWWPDIPDLCTRWPNIARACRGALERDGVEAAFIRHKEEDAIAAIRGSA